MLISVLRQHVQAARRQLLLPGQRQPFLPAGEAGMMAATSARRLWLNKAVSQPLRAGLYARADHRREVWMEQG
jgi:hypothetical protein